MAVPQQFSISLSGDIYTLRLYWNPPNQCWIMDVSDANGVPIVQGVPLVAGALLLEQYGYLGFPGDLFVQQADAPSATPAFDALGKSAKLYYAPGVGAGAA